MGSRVLGYRFQKWYFDLLSGDGDYLFGYLARVQMGLADQTQCSLHLCRPGNIPEILELPLGKVSFANYPPGFRVAGVWGRASLDQDGFRLQLRTDPLALEFEMRAQPGTWGRPLIIPGPAGSSIRWSPLVLRGGGEVRLTGPAREAASLSGYVDYVESDILPFLVPTRRLFWGRWHRANTLVVYTVYRDHRGQLAGLILLKMYGQSYRFNPIRVVPQKPRLSRSLQFLYPGETAVYGESGRFEVRLKASVLREAIASNFFGGGKLLPVFWRLISRNPRGVKCISRLEYSLRGHGESKTGEISSGIGEYVQFS